MYTDFDTLRAMLQVAHSPAYFSVKRALFADGLVGLASLFGAFNRACERLDDALYPAHSKVDVGKPVYIVAAPRSGTTFLHRLMSLDPQFTTFKLYQSFVPTVVGHKLADSLANAGGGFGALLHRLGSRVDSSSFGAWEGIHDTGLTKDEEDEALWALAFATPAIWLVLPFPERFDHLRFVDRLPPEKREKLVAYYRSCVQRHLFTTQGKTLLGKNVLLPGRFQIVKEAIPDARFVHILRHPYEAIPSTLSLFTVPWRWHSPEIRMDGPEAMAMAQLTMDYYRFLHEESLRSDAAGEKRFHCFTYDDLLKDPIARVQEVYERFAIPMSEEASSKLRTQVARQRGYKSEHTYSLAQFGLTKERVYAELKDVFDHYGFAR
jgi:hypothetical protein